MRRMRYCGNRIGTFAHSDNEHRRVGTKPTALSASNIDNIVASVSAFFRNFFSGT